jgi:hypothetical protein
MLNKSSKYKYLIISLVVLIVVVVIIIIRKRKANAPVDGVTNITQNNTQEVKNGTNNSVPDTFPLQPGATGDNVKYLQRALNKIGTQNQITVDGVLGSQTVSKIYLTVGTAYKLPLSQTKFNEILKKANS